MKELHKRTTMQPPDESFSITSISASLKPTEKEYLKIEEVLTTSEYYDPIFLNDFAPNVDMLGVTGLTNYLYSFQ